MGNAYPPTATDGPLALTKPVHESIQMNAAPKELSDHRLALLAGGMPA